MTDIIIDKDKLEKFLNAKDTVVDRIFVKYHNPKKERYKMTRERFAFILKYIEGPKMLDIGCGGGLAIYLLQDREDIKEFHGTDLQSAALELAKERVKNATFHRGFAEDLIYKDNYFDTVIITEALEHVANLTETLSEAHRVLKPNGRIVITVPYKGSTGEHHVRSFDDNFVKKILPQYFKPTKAIIKDFAPIASPKLFYTGRNL